MSNDQNDDIQDEVPPEYQPGYVPPQDTTPGETEPLADEGDYVAPPDAPHGSRNCYQNHMCRCYRCRAAQNDYMKAFRAERAARRTRRPRPQQTTNTYYSGRKAA
jgi:hypothetical protein